MYSSDGSGTYNFNSNDNKVTYGVELTNTGQLVEIRISSISTMMWTAISQMRRIKMRMKLM